MPRDEMTSEEIEDLKQEVEAFKKEKERVRKIVGQIGGMPSLRSRLTEVLFIVVVVLCLVTSILAHNALRFILIEVAIGIISLKIIHLINVVGRVNHFQLWILTSLEWRINELMKEIRKIDKAKKEKD